MWRTLHAHSVKWLFPLFVFSLPFQVRFVLFEWTRPFNEWTSAFLWATDILFALLITSNYKFQISKKDFFLLVFILIALVSISNALMPEVAWYRFVKLFEYILLFFFMRRQQITPHVLGAFVISALLQSVIGIGQSLLQHDLGLRLLGESVLDPQGTGIAVVVANASMFLRAYGTFPHPNLLALWLMLAVWALWAWRPRWHLYALPILLFALFLTFSRTAIAVWGLCSLWLWYQNRTDTKKIFYTLVITSLCFVIIFWPQVESRLHLSLQDEAVSQRIFYNEIATDTTRWFGAGIGQFVPNLIKAFPMYPRSLYQPAHNLYLLILNELGILGLALFLLFLFRGVRWSPVVVALLLLGLFDHYFWTLQQGGFVFWGLLGYFARDTIGTWSIASSDIS